MNARAWKAMILAGAFSVFPGCYRTAPTSDPTPPTIFLLKWEKTPQGRQGTQTTVNSGGQFTISQNWLGTGGATNMADIRIGADDNEGVRQLEVSGSARGVCLTKENSNLQVDELHGGTASFPTQTETADPGTVKGSMTIHLDDLLSNASCGAHRIGNMLRPQEFFLFSGTWMITARAENCCGNQTTGTFTIVVQ